MTEKEQCEKLLKRLESMTNPAAVEGMTKFGINPKNNYGLSIPQLTAIAKEKGMNHVLALELWETKVHDARIIACKIADPKLVTEEQMEKWVKDFDSWDVCDQCCSNLFDKTGFAYKKAFEWSSREEEFVKRAGFVMMAVLAVHDKKATDEEFIKFLHVIKTAASDERNFVKKAVNWALRQIGKRSMILNKASVKAAHEIQKVDSPAAKWIASDALRELMSEDVRKKLSRS